MANPWWKKKSEPATDYDYDDVYYGNSAKNTDAQPSEDGYDTYADNGDVNEVGVQLIAENLDHLLLIDDAAIRNGQDRLK